jgi:hypothetical protein
MLKAVSSEDFNLGAALADLLRRADQTIERLNCAIPAWEEVIKDLTSYDAKFDSLNQLFARPAGPGDVTFPSRQREVDDLNEEIRKLDVVMAERWRPFAALKADISVITHDLDVVLRRVPVSTEWPGLRASIEELGIMPLGWAFGPPDRMAEKFITLGIRLRRMIALGASEASNAKPEFARRHTQIPLPSGTRWSDIEIRFLGDHNFQVFVRGRAGEALDFEAAGFADRRGGERVKPNAAWSMLTFLANHDGAIKLESSETNRERVVKGVATLRKKLKELVGLDEDPFHPCRAGKYSAKFAVHKIPS